MSSEPTSTIGIWFITKCIRSSCQDFHIKKIHPCVLRPTSPFNPISLDVTIAGLRQELDTLLIHFYSLNIYQVQLNIDIFMGDVSVSYD